MLFIHILFLNCRFSNKYVFHVHVTAQTLSGNVIVISVLHLSRDLIGHF